jgi:hypothetical protein
VADNAEFGEVGGGDGTAAVVGEALVALVGFVNRCLGDEEEWLTSMLSYQYAFMIAVFGVVIGMFGRSNSGGVA